MMNVIGLIGGMSWDSTSERVIRGNITLYFLVNNSGVII